MKTPLRFAALSAGALVFAAAPQASAWDSICYTFEDPNAKVADLVHQTRGCQGLEAARGRFRDPVHLVDEHRRIFAQAATMAGLPAAALETTRLAVLTDFSSNVKLGGDGLTPTIDLLTPQNAKRAVFRSFALDELAQLPDFSFALWDWARGNEACPLAPLPAPNDEAQTCHLFESHMGATNSNHFPPQSDLWFSHYHALATGRAQQCAALRDQIWSTAPTSQQAARDARFAPSFRACEVEALAYEAVAQHFLQDSWSAGHMWERWGSTDLEAFPDLMAGGSSAVDMTWDTLPQRFRKLLVAEMVAISAGTIHGSDPPLFENATVPALGDAMCFPHEEVEAVQGGATFFVAGDLHLHDVTGGPPAHGDISPIWGVPGGVDYGTQAQKLLACAAGSIGEVYTALSGDFGAPVLGAPMGNPPMFDAAACKAPRVTNRAIHEGIDPVDAQPVIGEISAVLIDDIPGPIESLARNDYGLLRHVAWIASKLPGKAGTTELSNLHIPQSFQYEEQQCDEFGFCQQLTFTAPARTYTMLTVEPNRCYAAGGGAGCSVSPPGAGDPIAPFADPALPDPAMVQPPPDPADPGGALALAFHASRAPQLCGSVTAADLAALPSIVEDAESPVDRAAACDACAEWVAPFLRIGNDQMDYDTTAEPLCFHAAPPGAMVPYVYEPGTGTSDPSLSRAGAAGARASWRSRTPASSGWRRTRRAGPCRSPRRGLSCPWATSRATSWPRAAAGCSCRTARARSWASATESRSTSTATPATASPD